MRYITVQKKNISRSYSVAFLIHLIDSFSFSGKTDLQVIVPVDRDTFSLKCLQVIMINGHGKTDSSMFTKFAVGFIYKNFTHSHITVLRFYYMYAVMNCSQKHDHQHDLTIYHRIYSFTMLIITTIITLVYTSCKERSRKHGKIKRDGFDYG